MSIARADPMDAVEKYVKILETRGMMGITIKELNAAAKPKMSEITKT
ncbi:hypothetical protein COLO4_27764 [Corchorus olitorius]|uniref:Uncharacterized protein n=1 Tax=Corchorus olitorius TaxID=93759 RepID=A0A1R3HPA8_9ROSI|nr:hypothetical protein COLO4_27764 [Corchorus olitorius]